MSTVFEDFLIPLPADFPLPTDSQHSVQDYTLSARLYKDNAWDTVNDRTLVLYFHGSGTTGPLTGPLLDGLLAEGYMVLACCYFGVHLSSENPHPYEYYNVNAPLFISSAIKLSWWIQAALDFATGSIPSSGIVVLGHSLGATAAIAWGAGYTCKGTYPVKGIVASSATIAGLGDNSWNDMVQNISVTSQIISLLKVKTILAYSDRDENGPPDFQRRIQMAIEDDAPVYMVSPGNGTHTWTNNASYARFAVEWVKQIANDSVVKSRNGTAATKGASLK